MLKNISRKLQKKKTNFIIYAHMHKYKGTGSKKRKKQVMLSTRKVKPGRS